jgi:hypothetical protein
MCAVVVDVAWYWASNLRIQRAADAAALAGVVHLPNDAPTAFSVARAEATKNGYTSGLGGYTVTPTVDPGNPRRLQVQINGPVGTHFAKLFGIASLPANRLSKAEYVLPVPMGSPQNYYGVGFYEGRSAVVTDTPANTALEPPGAEVTGGSWVNPSRARTNNESSGLTTASSDGAAQIWRDFDLLSGSGMPDDPTLVIDRIEVGLRGVSVVGGLAGDTCRVDVDLSWGGGAAGTWTTVRQTSILGNAPGAAEEDRTVGDTGSIADWGAHAWTRTDFTNGNFRARLTWEEGGSTGCPVSRSVQLDQLRVRVIAHTVATTWTNQALNVPNPLGGTLASQGFWGAMFTPGGIRTNGDRYGPADIGYNAVGNPPRDAANPDHDGLGYDYTIELGTNGQVRLFDPVFCATGGNGHGGSYGAGDHWTEHATGASSSPTVIAPVASTYSLYNAGANLYSTLDDTWIGDLRYDPGGSILGDFSGAFGVPQNQSDGITGADQDCANHPAHNAWVLPAGWSGLPAGFYRLNVNTSVTGAAGAIDTDNFNVGAENLFSIWVSSAGGNARVYGGGKMAAYTNLDAGNQSFFFAQIEQVHAGKTMVITLFDPGESSGNAYLRILSPEGDTYDYATFDWSSNDGRSGSGTQIQTSDGTPLFDNKILTIRVRLPASYAVGSLDPDNIGEEGWWKIEYQTSAANDTTTWQVELIGNPVHLVVP